VLGHGHILFPAGQEEVAGKELGDMGDRLLDRLELGARVAQSLVAENELSTVGREAAITWRSESVLPAPRRAPRARKARRT
jgi:hypothetical protein